MVFVKLLGRRPETVYKFEPIRDDLEFGNSAYPMVLVQIPMYNEREVYQLMTLLIPTHSRQAIITTPRQIEDRKYGLPSNTAIASTQLKGSDAHKGKNIPPCMIQLQCERTTNFKRSSGFSCTFSWRVGGGTTNII